MKIRSRSKPYLIAKACHRILDARGAEDMIVSLARIARLDLLRIAYNSIGVLKYENMTVTGECYLISDILPKLFRAEQDLVLFDVGANCGEYTKLLHESFSAARIYAFEPNPEAFQALEAATGGFAHCLRHGVGKDVGKRSIYAYGDGSSSQHGSVHRDAMTDFYHGASVRELTFDQVSIDRFCASEGVSRIHLLKIDTEGNEAEVLEGAREMLRRGRIDVVQLEFGELQVFARTFMKDIYAALEGFDLFRLDSYRLIPLGRYTVNHEIFRFQNIIAIRQGIREEQVCS